VGFPLEFLDELRNRVSLADAIERRVKLTRRGREHLGLCPFHNEKTPSFTLNEEKGFYHCFGCGAHGDVIEFVMRTENLPFPEAIEQLAGDAGLAVPESSPQDQKREKERHSLLEVVEAAALWFAEQLASERGKEARAYLQGRGLNEATLDAFRLGFAPDSRVAMKQSLTAKGISENLLVDAGLVITPEDGRDSYDRFRNRIIFPITDRHGRAIAFGGRALVEGIPVSDSKTRKIAKYLNSPETPLFHKGHVLYGLAQALPAMREKQQALVTEGYMDVIALHRAGLTHVVAPLGTALTEDQIRLLWRAVDEPILCFDGDTAGARAAGRVAERALPLLISGKSLRFACLPTGEDPDSLVKHGGAAAMDMVIATAKPLSEVIWKIEASLQSVDTPERRASLESRIMARVRTIADRTVRGHYARDFKDRLWQSFRESQPRSASQGAPKGGSRFRSPTSAFRASVSGTGGEGAGTSGHTNPQVEREKVLLALVIAHPQMLDDVVEQLGSMAFVAAETDDLDALRQEILLLAERENLDKPTVESHLLECGFGDALKTLSKMKSIASYLHADAADSKARALWDHTLNLHQLPEIEAQLKEAEQADDWALFSSLKNQILAIKAESIEDELSQRAPGGV
jgi:DNA primase